MSVEQRDDVIHLRGACPAQDAETLASLLIRQRSSLVDASACTELHSAVLQVLLAFKPKIAKAPADRALDDLISQVAGENDG